MDHALAQTFPLPLTYFWLQKSNGWGIPKYILFTHTQTNTHLKASKKKHFKPRHNRTQIQKNIENNEARYFPIFILAQQSSLVCNI